MAVIGIIGEYNPFHLGHAYHIRKSRELVGGSPPVVCVMSGCFVQRGEAALFSPQARAAAAVAGGADLVLELPVPWALASAEGFARGGVGLLESLGVVTHLSFGSESGDTMGLEMLAMSLLEPEFQSRLQSRWTDETQSYAAVRQALLREELGSVADRLEDPNDILAVEYIKAIKSLGSGMFPLAVPRVGAAHDETQEGPKRKSLLHRAQEEKLVELRSASSLRGMIREGEDPTPFLPAASLPALRNEESQGIGPVDPERLEIAMLSRLRRVTEEEMAALPDATGGLDRRLFEAARQQPGLDAILAAAKSKRYAMSRLRRMCCCAALGITAAANAGTPPYARVLAANETGRGLLRTVGERATLPVLTKPAAVRELSAACQEVFRLESEAYDLWRLAAPGLEARTGGSAWRQSPYMG